MGEREDLLKSISTTAADYRRGEIAPMTPRHVDRWVRQFDEADQLTILQEMDRVLKTYYISRKKARTFIEVLLAREEICGPDPLVGMHKTKFLCIQKHGNSQRELLALVNEVLRERHELHTSICGRSPASYLYLDDCLVSGYTLLHDLERWLPEALDGARLHIALFAMHNEGKEYFWKKLKDQTVPRRIKPKIWNLKTIDKAGCMWPRMPPGDEQTDAYIRAVRERCRMAAIPVQLFRGSRQPPEETTFSSPEARDVVERAFFKVGVHIISLSRNAKPELRPMGYKKLESLGGGALSVTYRNCPNNCPLALWWGDPSEPPTRTLGKWYPLFNRKPNGVPYEYGV